MTYSGRWTGAVAAVLGFALAAAPAAAQINPFGVLYGPRMTSPDVALLTQAANRLLAAPAKVGQSESWSNPATGASGTVTETRTFAFQGMDCRGLHYEMVVGGQPDPRGLNLSWCKTASGEWKIASPG